MDIVAEGVEATVPATVRELVEAVACSDEPLSIAKLANLVALDKSATSRRWQNARARGYLRNLEEKKGKPARIVLGDPLPDEVEILPLRARLEECCGVAAASAGSGVAPEPGTSGYPAWLAERVRSGEVSVEDGKRLLAEHKERKA